MRTSTRPTPERAIYAEMENGCPSLVVFSGLPGTGKTTVAKALAATLGAVYLRIDTIEQAMKSA